MKIIFIKYLSRAKNLGIYPIYSFSLYFIQFFSSQFLNVFSNLNIRWFALNENGFINDLNEFLQNKAVVYIYLF